MMHMGIWLNLTMPMDGPFVDMVLRVNLVPSPQMTHVSLELGDNQIDSGHDWVEVLRGGVKAEEHHPC